MLRNTTLSMAAVIAAALLAPVARADIQFSLNPAVQTVTVGDTLNYDLLVSGLVNNSLALGAYDVVIGYEASILTPTLLSFTNRLGDPSLFEVIQSNSFFPATVEITELSLLSVPALFARQVSASSFALATLTFQSIAAGVSPLSLTVTNAADQDAVSLAATGAGGEAVVQSGGVSGVPEPSAIWLLLTAAGGVYALRRRAARK